MLVVAPGRQAGRQAENGGMNPLVGKRAERQMPGPMLV